MGSFFAGFGGFRFNSLGSFRNREGRRALNARERGRGISGFVLANSGFVFDRFEPILGSFRVFWFFAEGRKGCLLADRRAGIVAMQLSRCVADNAATVRLLDKTSCVYDNARASALVARIFAITQAKSPGEVYLCRGMERVPYDCPFSCLGGGVSELGITGGSWK